jgi:hypothetical protein
MSEQMSEMEKKQREQELKKIQGTAKNIEINERSITATREEFAKKGLVVTNEYEYPIEEFLMIAKQKEFDRLADPKQGIKKVIGSMIRQPVTIFNKQGKPEIKDALYYSGNYHGVDKRGSDLPSAEFREGLYFKPKLTFSYTDAANPYDSKTGERRGEYKVGNFEHQYYIYLPEDKKERRKILEDIINKSPGTYTGNLATGHLHYRNPSPNNDRSGAHGGSFSWDLFCDLNIQQLGELQNKRYYTDDAGIIRDATGQRVQYDPSTKRVETTKDR